MSVQAITMSDFARSYKDAKSKDEEVLIILDIIKQSQVENKKEILTEIKHDDLVTKQYLDIKLKEIDLKIANTELKLTEQIGNAKWQVIGSMLVFFIAGVVAKHFGF